MTPRWRAVSMFSETLTAKTSGYSCCSRCTTGVCRTHAAQEGLKKYARTGRPALTASPRGPVRPAHRPPLDPPGPVKSEELNAEQKSDEKEDAIAIQLMRRIRSASCRGSFLEASGNQDSHQRAIGRADQGIRRDRTGARPASDERVIGVAERGSGQDRKDRSYRGFLHGCVASVAAFSSSASAR